MLWTGAAYREFASWRERYSGGLSDLEEAYADAMTLAASRRRRRRRIAATVAIVLALAIASVFGVLWRRSVLETRRAEAQKLLALAQIQLEIDPSEALAYTTASLQLTDTPKTRRFALRALWAGPLALALNIQHDTDGMFVVPTFSPDGRWLAVAGIATEKVLVYGKNGEGPIGLAVTVSQPRALSGVSGAKRTTWCRVISASIVSVCGRCPKANSSTPSSSASGQTRSRLATSTSSQTSGQPPKPSSRCRCGSSAGS